MPKRSRKVQKKKLPVRHVSKAHVQEQDENQAAFETLQAVIGRIDSQTRKDPLAVMLGRRGGLKGGKARAERMTAVQRKASARHAARARWSK
jgi:hypothetical protein